MRRRIILGLAVCMLTPVPGRAGVPTNAFVISYPRQCVYLSVLTGRLTVGRLNPEVEHTGQPDPGRWYIEATRIKSTTGDGYLAYDPSKDDGKVFLADRPGDGTEWVVSVGERTKAREGERAEIRAASGPMKGWYLGAEEVEEKGEDGKPVTTRRLLLAKDPPRKLEAQRIWLHY